MCVIFSATNFCFFCPLKDQETRDMDMEDPASVRFVLFYFFLC